MTLLSKQTAARGRKEKEQKRLAGMAPKTLRTTSQSTAVGCWVVSIVLAVLILFAVGTCGISPEGSPPYPIVETEDQPAQFLIQIVVPHGSTRDQVKEWHREVQRKYRHRGRHLFVNYYDDPYETSRLIVNGTESGDVGWLGLE